MCSYSDPESTHGYVRGAGIFPTFRLYETSPHNAAASPLEGDGRGCSNEPTTHPASTGHPGARSRVLDAISQEVAPAEVLLDLGERPVDVCLIDAGGGTVRTSGGRGGRPTVRAVCRVEGVTPFGA